MLSHDHVHHISRPGLSKNHPGPYSQILLWLPNRNRTEAPRRCSSSTAAEHKQNSTETAQHHKCTRDNCMIQHNTTQNEPTCRERTLPMSSYMSISSRAALLWASMLGVSVSSRACSCCPRAVSPYANCATFVRSRQSMQLVRNTPCCNCTLCPYTFRLQCSERHRTRTSWYRVQDTCRLNALAFCAKQVDL